jgi:hypothetical protein
VIIVLVAVVAGMTYGLLQSADGASLNAALGYGGAAFLAVAAFGFALYEFVTK